jgi:general secretion pathway protein A
LNQGDGFVVVTGEVGTGKTTLCRLFLEQLDADTESAYIFNPKLESAELLASICNEFGIRTQEKSLKALLDILNDYLILKTKLGRKVVLLIDEAQNLSIENLEMVRMLSNLETTRQKLLQIILVGQPELSDKLDSYELRQLSQRISLGCYLAPLTIKETEKYIQHRLAIAAQRPVDLFTTGACRLIHRATNGIPRLVNIVADRSLLTAFSQNRKKVTSAIAETAIKEVSERGHRSLPKTRWKRIGWAAVILVVFIGLGAWLTTTDWVMEQLSSSKGAETSTTIPVPKPQETTSFKIPQTNSESKSPTTQSNPLEVSDSSAEDGPSPLLTSGTPSQEGSLTASVAEAAPIRSAQPMPLAQSAMNESAIVLKDIVSRLEPVASRKNAVTILLDKWRLSAPVFDASPMEKDDFSYFRAIARQNGLRLYRVADDWSKVEQLNMPTIVALKSSEPANTVYLGLIGRDGQRLWLAEDVGATPFETTYADLKPYLEGQTFVFWKNIFGFDAIISHGSHEAAIMALKDILRKIGYGIMDTPEFDPSTQAAVLAFQQHHQIEADGLVGPLTKIMLIHDANAFQFPQLSPHMDTGS